MNSTSYMKSPFRKMHDNSDYEDSELLNETENEVTDKQALKTKNILDSLKDFANLSRLLRITGAMAVVASMSAFLMQDWSIGNDLNRFYLLLIQTLVLASGGFALSFLMKENKGARVFFGLGLLSITANMTTLGALIFSKIQWASSLNVYPEFLTWTATSMSAIGLAVLSALVVIVPISLFSYMVFARRHAKLLIFTFIATNLMLLIPVRESFFAGIIAIIAVVMPLWHLRKKVLTDTSLKTPEGMFAIATLCVPALIIITRNFWLYQADELLIAMLAAMSFLTFRVLSEALEITSYARKIMNVASIVAAAYFAYNITIALLPLITNAYGLSSMAILFSLLTLDVAHRSGTAKIIYTVIAVFSLIVGHLMLLSLHGGALSAVLTIIVGIAVVWLAKSVQSKAMLVAGVMTAVMGVIYQMYSTLVKIDFSNWITLAAIGVIAIVIASIMERHGTVLKHKWQQWSKFKAIE